MPPKFKTQPSSTATTTPSNPSTNFIDPIILILWILPYSFLHLPTITLLSPMIVYAFVLLPYFMVVLASSTMSSLSPRASDQPRTTFFPDLVNEQYINRMSIFRVHVHYGWDRHCAHGLARDRNRVKSVIVSYAIAGISSVVLAYVMSMLLIRIKIPGYLY
ncbi:hypothetical protein ACFX2F_013212 [Malus domestica]